jgi:two-component sensor histidine kinase
MEAGVQDPAEQNSLDRTPQDATGPRLQQRELKHRELDHRLANSLQLATDFLLFAQVRVGDEAAQEALGEAAARLLAVGQLHRFLSAHDATESVDLPSFLTHLSGLIAGSTGLRCSLHCDQVSLPADIAQQLAIVINELAMNAAKHGYRPGQPGSLHFEARCEGSRLRLSVCDTGGGLDKAFDVGPSKGLGMSIVEAIVRQLRATLDAADDHGAVFTITLPLTASAPRVSRSFAPPNPL